MATDVQVNVRLDQELNEWLEEEAGGRRRRAGFIRELEGPARRALDWILHRADRTLGYVAYATRSPAGLQNHGWRDRANSMLFRDGTHAEEGGMREGGDDARSHQGPVVRRERTGEIACREDHHQRHQQRLAAPAAGQRAKKRRAHDHAQRVAGNQQPRRRDRNPEIGAHLQEQAHDDEFGDADAEGAGGQRVESERHAIIPSIV
jgi:hypothetical protein